jgi:hypothetical protein
MKKRKLFVFNVSNVIDLITNSSSELFILSGNNMNEVKSLIESVYPNYLSEYKEVVSIESISNNDLDTYLTYEYNTWDDKLTLSKVFNIDPNVLYSNYSDFETKKYWHGRISDVGYSLIREKLPKDMYFLYSINENPNWEMQENLMNIATRYHLG